VNRGGGDVGLPGCTLELLSGLEALSSVSRRRISLRGVPTGEVGRERDRGGGTMCIARTGDDAIDFAVRDDVRERSDGGSRKEGRAEEGGVLALAGKLVFWRLAHDTDRDRADVHVVFELEL
jgi:hypothetical protein